MNYLTHLNKETPKTAITSQYGLEYTYPIKYYDFHIYYYGHNADLVKESEALKANFLSHFELVAKDGSVIVKELFDDKVIGPHVTQFWEVDVCRPEVFISVLSWFQLNHGKLSVLIHPQTGNDLLDHTEHALWLGEKLPLITSIFKHSEGIPEFGVKGGKRINAEHFG